MLTYCCYFKYRGATNVLARGAKTCPVGYGERVETLGGVKAQLLTVK